MADNLVLQGTTPEYLPTGQTLATKDVGAGVHAGVSVITDPANPTRFLAPNADGSLTTTAGGTDITGSAIPAGGAGERGWLSALGNVFGLIGDAVWDGSAASSTVMKYLRYAGVKLEAIRAALVDPSAVSTVAASGGTWPLGTGAATAAKQPALGTAGTSAADVISVQGIASGTALPVSGTVTATVAAKSTLWATPASRGNQITTELNSLANGGFSAAGPAYDNMSNKDQFGLCDITLASLTPTAGANLRLYLVMSLDGTTFEDAPGSTNPGTHMLVAIVDVTTGVAAKRIMTRRFELPPTKFKFVLLNNSGVALNAANNTVALYTSNDQAQ